MIAFTVFALIILFGVNNSTSMFPTIITFFSREHWINFTDTNTVIILPTLAFYGAGGTLNLT